MFLRIVIKVEYQFRTFVCAWQRAAAKRFTAAWQCSWRAPTALGLHGYRGTVALSIERVLEYWDKHSEKCSWPSWPLSSGDAHVGKDGGELQHGCRGEGDDPRGLIPVPRRDLTRYYSTQGLGGAHLSSIEPAGRPCAAAAEQAWPRQRHCCCEALGGLQHATLGPRHPGTALELKLGANCPLSQEACVMQIAWWRAGCHAVLRCAPRYSGVLAGH